jgi:hypothetical protein
VFLNIARAILLLSASAPEDSAVSAAAKSLPGKLVES